MLNDGEEVREERIYLQKTSEHFENSQASDVIFVDPELALVFKINNRVVKFGHFIG